MEYKKRNTLVVSRAFFTVFLVLFLSAYYVWADELEVKSGDFENEAHMKITSPGFIHNSFIPKKYTCQGDDVNPELVISGVPSGTKTLTLIMDDPDAPMGTWVHWVVFNIPVITKIDEDSVPGQEGENSWSRLNYGGPCPPRGTHRYFFKIYALDIELALKEGATKSEVETAMKGHILEKFELVGLYEK